MSLALNPDESVTVPSGDTWVITIASNGQNSTVVDINNSEMAKFQNSDSQDSQPGVHTLVDSGDTITSLYSGSHIGGWSL